MKTESRRDPRALGMAAGWLVVLVLSAVAVHPDRVSGAEEAVFRALNAIPDLAYWPVWVVMQLGNLLAIPAAALVVLISRRWRLAGALLLAGGAKTVLSRAVKDVVTRHRPASVIDDVVRRGDASATGEAFVSGHAVIAFSIAVLVHPYLPPGKRWIPWALATVVCVGRVYVGAHLPLDVVGGAALGTAVGMILRFLCGTASGHADERRLRKDQ